MTPLEAEFAELVRRLKKPGVAIFYNLTPSMCDLLHMAIGVSSDSGELLDAVKKHVIYNKPLDLDNVYEELGDIEWFLEGIRQVLNIRREDVLSRNLVKLNTRYPLGCYTDGQALTRADKV